MQNEVRELSELEIEAVSGGCLELPPDWEGKSGIVGGSCKHLNPIDEP